MLRRCVNSCQKLRPQQSIYLLCDVPLAWTRVSGSLCEFARRLWSALSSAPHFDLVAFVRPVVFLSDRRLVELRSLFFHLVWKLSRRNRFSSDPLKPITETALERRFGRQFQ
ncbi:BZ3500_MvSof-1268-A1-R1_Chr10-1g02686 [Microbotryum saponariae]|uniref:BZ3500_MvSof-1268-A1-R1_Chr10-1g02686 protein n=1 Tax=Microbotryum saponariae TaxID=289078 RepID=A0A2X0L9R3_9BASI|nr:BZ3500_MvSof-1268-A1-R1_Chr10-1g02686 [Microbotryum saponariae]SDA06175.1 BZ3501_MvSof-1269-A2-R1_Chr10-1g02287 [Microbotryum saponariae]